MPFGPVLKPRSCRGLQEFESVTLARNVTNSLRLFATGEQPARKIYGGILRRLCGPALGYFITCGPKHFEYLIAVYVEHDHTERPHQALGNLPLGVRWATLLRANQMLWSATRDFSSVRSFCHTYFPNPLSRISFGYSTAVHYCH